MIKIEPLKNHANLIPDLVCLWHDTLGKKWAPQISTNEISTWYSDWLNETIPMAYVALSDGLLVGSFSLQWDDGIRPDLYPWLGDVIVSPEHQNQGIGKLLINFAMQTIKNMGYSTLYLFTFEDSLVGYYLKFGWNIIGNDNYENKPVIVMSVDL